MAVRIIQERCPQNHKCPSVRVCTVGALRQEGLTAPEVDETKCIDCNRCVRKCPKGVFEKKN